MKEGVRTSAVALRGRGICVPPAPRPPPGLRRAEGPSAEARERRARRAQPRPEPRAAPHVHVGELGPPPARAVSTDHTTRSLAARRGTACAYIIYNYIDIRESIISFFDFRTMVSPTCFPAAQALRFGRL